MKIHSRYFFRGMTEHGLSGLATQAAHLTMPRSVPACKAAVSARTGHQAWARRVPELTIKALDIPFLLFIFCHSGFGSKYGPSNSETLHMEEWW